MQRLKQAYSFSLFSKELTTIKVQVTASSPPEPLPRQSSSAREVRTESQPAPATRSSGKNIECRPLSSSTIPFPPVLTDLACANCKTRKKTGQPFSCINYFCRRCGTKDITIIRAGRGCCEDCKGESEGRDVRVATPKRKGKQREDCETNPIECPGQVREKEILRKAEEAIEASIIDSLSPCSSTAAVIGCGRRDRDTQAERARFRGSGNLRTRRKCKGLRLNLPKLCTGEEDCANCGEQRCGTVVGDGDGITIRTCPDELLVLVSVDQHPAYERVIFNAAQIGSPTGLAEATCMCLNVSEPSLRNVAGTWLFRNICLKPAAQPLFLSY